MNSQQGSGVGRRKFKDFKGITLNTHGGTVYEMYLMPSAQRLRRLNVADTPYKVPFGAVVARDAHVRVAGEHGVGLGWG